VTAGAACRTATAPRRSRRILTGPAEILERLWSARIGTMKDVPSLGDHCHRLDHRDRRPTTDASRLTARRARATISVANRLAGNLAVETKKGKAEHGGQGMHSRPTSLWIEGTPGRPRRMVNRGE
jgi:hypothetical protein